MLTFEGTQIMSNYNQILNALIAWKCRYNKPNKYMYGDAYSNFTFISYIVFSSVMFSMVFYTFLLVFAVYPTISGCLH